MLFKKVCVACVCSMVMLTSLVGCSEVGKESSMKSSEQRVHKSDERKGKKNGEKRSKGQLNTLAKQNDKMAASKDDAVPPLRGGPEKDERELKLVSNSILQRKFPQTLVMRGSLHDNRVALTFDDGPDRRFTPKVLDVLKKHHVKATFFVMGSRVKGLPDVTKRMHQEGHVIGNHTFWHPKLYEESLERMWWEVTETENAIAEVTGYPPKLFRAPYGGLNEKLLQKMAEMNLTVVGWSVDSLDWKGISAQEVENNVLGNTMPGSIILMHSGGHWTQDLSGMVEALDTIIPKLKKEGIQFVTVSELLNIADRKK